ncbi:hypothetical protein SARC_03291 [Sphaeroforma arctica JP610]|uniref:Uncharacterized protein n=1 Tax=Sphaeroforma arctica JP610 TaxID=667725 RepID=A0A0L0G6H8_9EUKA|nr:hypothetical protein SARC_03291 [Sphaeroforma arctica JP610]KNC84486.1 hypothetical protein SARC_03291 [Sphaeroforma arctica JP610]|eukprot:XP_014158388.1 hypothetical protein SARC_03291 [Sphaeroforma arctica JP610]
MATRTTPFPGELQSYLFCRDPELCVYLGNGSHLPPPDRCDHRRDLDSVLGCPEPTISLQAELLPRDVQAARAVAKVREAQNEYADRHRVDAPMIEIGREVIYTTMQAPNHKHTKDWLGPVTVLAHTAPVMHYIFDKAMNKECRVHIENIEAHLPPIGRPELRPVRAIAASAIGSWLFFSSPLADEGDDEHLDERVAMFRTSAPAMRFLYGCSTAFNKWITLLKTTGRPRGDDFTADDEDHFSSHADKVTNPATTLSTLRKANTFAHSRAERDSKIASWQDKQLALKLTTTAG